MEMSHEQALQFIAAGHRPPETGPLADLLRSAHPVMAPDELVPPPSPRSTEINVAMVR
jgi:hypothetical protein